MSSNKNIKTAAGFGGVGGAGSGNWAPGGSPGGSTYGDFNQFISDQSFESILARSHNPPDDDEKRNFEARLVPFHNFKEDDILGNIDVLDPVERERIKLRARLRQHKSMLEDAANNMHKSKATDNKESYISMEDSLSKRRKYKEKQKFDYEDDVPAQIKPERLHYASTRQAKDFTSKSRGQITESGPDDNPFYEAQYSNPQLAKTPVLTDGADLEKYFKDLKNEYTPDEDGFRNETTILDTLDPDASRPNFSGRSSADSYDPSEQDKTLEQQLHTEEYVYKDDYSRNNRGNEPISFDDNPGLKGQGNFSRVPWAGSNL